MSSRRRKAPREKDLTSRYLSGDTDEQMDRVEQRQRFTAKNKGLTQSRIERTALLRAAEQQASDVDVERLPAGEVVQVYSLYCQVAPDGPDAPDATSASSIASAVNHTNAPSDPPSAAAASGGGRPPPDPGAPRTYLCVTRKTLTKLADTQIVVGDRVRFRPTGSVSEDGQPEAVIEHAFPRRTVLTRADSFLDFQPKPIVANADRMLIVASLVQPGVRWGLIDRMLVAARAGGLEPVIVLNKVDLARSGAPAGPPASADGPPPGDDPDPGALAFARAALEHYRATLGVASILTSVHTGEGVDAVRDVLRDRVTVLAGHSGVGKSSLIRAVQPHLDLRVGDVSAYTNKGRHTTTSARRYPLDFGGHVVDTPGVKLFGLWGVTRDNVLDHFPDVEADTAPTWRRESYERIVESLGDGETKQQSRQEPRTK